MRLNGMTKIELLIVATIVGVLGIAAVVAITTARSATRDAVRLGDIFQVQTELEYHFLDHNAYPVVQEALPIGGPSATCLSERGWGSACEGDQEVYLSPAPMVPQAGLGGLSQCDGYKNAYCYVATEDAYRIQFELENANPLLELEKGLNCATEQGVRAGTCPALP